MRLRHDCKRSSWICQLIIMFILCEICLLFMHYVYTWFLMFIMNTLFCFYFQLHIRCQFRQQFTCSFYARRYQKRQMTLLPSLSIFAHSGSTCVKAVHRTLMKLSPGRLTAANVMRTYDNFECAEELEVTLIPVNSKKQ